MSEILITSLVSSTTEEPRVDITLPKNRIQISASEAINLAHQIIECAMGAYADAFIYNFLTTKVFKGSEDSKNIAGNIMLEFREYRDKLKLDFDSYQK